MPRTARFLTPTLHLGDTSPLPHTEVSTADQAVVAAHGGIIAVTPDPAVALEALVRLGVPEAEAKQRVLWAQGLVTDVDVDFLGDA